MAAKLSYTQLEQRIEALQREKNAHQAMARQFENSNKALRNEVNRLRKYRQLMESARAIIIVLNLEFTITSVSSEIESIIGLAPDEMAGRPFSEFIHPDDIEKVAQLCEQVVAGSPQTGEFRLHAPDKGDFWIRAWIVPQMQHNTCVGLAGLVVGIDDRKKAEQALAAREARYRTIIENSQEGYFETNLDGEITFCNRALLSISGYSREELMAKTLREMAPPRTIRALQAMFGRMLRTGKDAEVSNYEVFHKHGHTLTVEFGASLIQGRGGQPVGYRGFLRDISEQIKAMRQQKQLQAQLHQAQKMEALGTLAGGLAHGFNNVLMAIQGNLSLIRMSLPEDHSMRKHLDRINQSADKGVNLAKQILSFAKMGKFVVMPTNMNSILKSTSRMFVRSKDNLRIHEYYEKELWETQVDRVQIGQLLLSLYMNASEAMPDGGDLYLQSENIVLDRNYTKPYNAEPGRYIKISVTDSGMGLDEAAKQRIFEPFYSAYNPSRYGRLGLAAVYGTVKSHKGIINVYSEKGHGTTFTIYLPISKKDQLKQSPDDLTRKGSETILLVDDDELAAGAGREILERSGYRVLVANNGGEAIDIYQEYASRIDLVLLDIILPDMAGEQVFHELKRLNPNTRVIVASGYSVNKQISALLNQGCDDFVQKPFQTQPLSAKVRSALDRKPPLHAAEPQH